MRNNPAAPITVKRKLLSSCLNASLLYGCETWSSASLRKAESLYRKARKITFGMINNTPNEIIFIESGLIELKSEIYKRQYKFWVKTLEMIDPQSEVSKMLTKALEKMYTILGTTKTSSTISITSKNASSSIKNASRKS